MTPPVGCWTFFTWLSTTIVPGATTAPDSSVIHAHPPRPPTRRATPPSASRVWRLMDWRAFD